MSRADRIREEFGGEISEIADDILDAIPMSSMQLRLAFNDEELGELEQMLRAVRAAGDENAKTAKLIEHGRVAFKLLSKLGVAV
jgi:hypothetical protein